MTWNCRQLTSGTAQGRYHAHSYYDVPVMDATERFLAAHRIEFVERHPDPGDVVEVGVIDIQNSAANWQTVGVSRAWSWQQGPHTQWVPGTQLVLWNDRDGDTFVTRLHDHSSGQTRTLPRPAYAVDPSGRYFLSLNMARLNGTRPGYGYAGGSGARLDDRFPADDGVWKIDLATGQETLLLSCRRAVKLLSRFRPRSFPWRQWHSGMVYWFNHAKISPNGKRFTVKLRWRSRNLAVPWTEAQGVSLTCGTDGNDLRLLDEATSHVIWLNDDELFFWQRDGVYLNVDTAPVGQRRHAFFPEHLRDNVHLRRLPGTAKAFVYDTPYRETVDVCYLDAASGEVQTIATFNNHRPAAGPFRCDLHPCPSATGRHVVVTSLDDGGRQLYLLTREQIS